MTVPPHDHDHANSCSCMEENKDGIRTIFSYKAIDNVQNETRNSTAVVSDARNQRTPCCRMEENS